ncbi:dephospho-CoA kinase [Polynucleobacter tropicus]|uniref:Dephospho-CoA kinase n=1 Tax=Polynucleobacter tropicus TaxID=1743174 RepID=A0A6M9PZF0_9BURK|nr:dephospho-CoA kinase [Polynucleobacter tropicus]QKM65621.1 dephospho-CoA kinase [Polynucleobacter tropicus]
MPLIGLTGGIGSGKTAVSDQLGKLGAGIIDTDVIAHQITAANGPAIEPIQKHFGPDYIDANGALDRAKMRTLVFANPDAKQALEAITHPLIRQEAIKQAFQEAKGGAPYLVFVVPLLLESGTWIDLIDRLVVVDCPVETQISRVMQRNNLSRAEVEKILQSQASREDRLAQADFVIKNQGSLDQLIEEVNQLNQKILKI